MTYEKKRQPISRAGVAAMGATAFVVAETLRRRMPLFAALGIAVAVGLVMWAVLFVVYRRKLGSS